MSLKHPHHWTLYTPVQAACHHWWLLGDTWDLPCVYLLPYITNNEMLATSILSQECLDGMWTDTSGQPVGFFFHKAILKKEETSFKAEKVLSDTQKNKLSK